MRSSTPSTGLFKRALVGGTAAATLAGAVVLGLPGTASAASANAPEKPTITTTVDGNTVDFEMADPNTGFRQALTTCSPALIDIEKAIPLLPSIADGTLPPLEDIDPAMFAWGPRIAATSVAGRNFSEPIPDVPNGIYLAIGVCLNPAALSEPAIAFTPVFVGSPINVGSAALGLGSGVLATPGGLGAVLGLLGIDTGSLGSLGSAGSSDSGGSAGSMGSSGSSGSSATDASTDAAGSGSAGSLSDSLAQGIGSNSQLGSSGSAFGSTDTATGSAVQF